MVKRKKKEKEIINPKQEEEFFCDDVKLTREQLLEIKCSHLERESINKEIKTLFTELQLIDRHKELMNLKMSDLKSKATLKDKDHKEVIENIGRRIGVNLKDSVINFETGKVTFS